jgi:NAD-dependent deacetylase
MTQQPDATLVQLLTAASRTLVFTGAGISTVSGIPDYRGPQGIWKTRQPVYYQDFMASEEARVTYWEHKLEDWEAFGNAEPNAVHHAVAALERAGRLLMVVTQNIDGLHGKAGTSPERLVEIHGTNAEVECQSCGLRSDPGPAMEAFRRERKAPRCESCGGVLKSATISFGQSLREQDLQRAAGAVGEADLVLALGSTLSVHPAASIPLAAASRGAPYVIINRGQTDQDGHPLVTLRLEGDVAEILPPAVDAVCGG